MDKMKAKRRLKTVLTAVLSTAMATTMFYAPPFSSKDENTAKAAATIGQIRTFNNTSTGPFGADVNNSSGTLGGNVTMSGGMYLWTVPETGTYEIDTYGAQGGEATSYSYFIGNGARMKGDFHLKEGQILKILVGQRPDNATSAGGGGGGSFVVTNTNMPLIVAGGGAGESTYGSYNQGVMHGTTSTIGQNNSSGHLGGIAGNGGTWVNQHGGGPGGGFSGNGQQYNTTTNYFAQGGMAFLSGGNGGAGYLGYASSAHSAGGFGGGGHAGHNGGGGGGYSGGSGSYHSSSNAGGGGSFNTGSNQTNTAGVKTGHGQVMITFKANDANANKASSAAFNQSRTFNNTSTGRAGANVDNSTGTLGGNIAVSGGMYEWTVPESGNYRIEARGAQGGDASNFNSYGAASGGLGALIKGDFFLTKGTTLRILVGQQGKSWTTASSSGPAGGGGGTFVTVKGNGSYNTDYPLVVAGGGGGAYSYSTRMNGRDAVTTINGVSTSYSGGTNGSGGLSGGNSSGGGGFLGNGGNSNQGHVAYSYVNGGLGANQDTTWGATGQEGGFGGGGNGALSSGGGGGFSGGGAGVWSSPGGGGGGGSYNVGVNQINSVANTGHGQVIINYLTQTVTQSPANGTKFQDTFVDVSWTVNKENSTTISRYEIQAGTTSGGSNILGLTNKGTSTTQRLTVPPGLRGNTTIYWQVRAIDSNGYAGPWKESTVVYFNNVPTITATTNAPANLTTSWEKRHHLFTVNSLIDPDSFNYVTLKAEVLDKNGTIIPGSRKQIVLDSSLINSASLISGTSTDKDGSLQGPINHTTPFNLKLFLEPDFTNGTFDLTLTKENSITNVIKSGNKLLENVTMQNGTDPSPENYTLRIYPEDRQNSYPITGSALTTFPDVTPISIPFTLDTRNNSPVLTNMKDDVAERVFSENQGFNKISVTGHVVDTDSSDDVTIYYEVQPKAEYYYIDVTTSDGKVIPANGTATQTFNPQVDDDFAFTYQIDSTLESKEYALLVYGYDSKEGIGDIHEIPFTVDRAGPIIDFTAEYVGSDGKTIIMSTPKKQKVAEKNKLKMYFTPNNYATFQYAGYLIRDGLVKDLRIRGAFTNEVKASFIGVDLGQDSITLMNGETTKFKLGDVLFFTFKATSSTGVATNKDIRILIADDNSTFDSLDDANLPNIP